jgi:hypothetical protein
VQPFIHERIQRFDHLLSTASAALRAYNDLELETATIVVGFLAETSAAYQTMGNAAAENEMLALQAQLTSARRGVDPMTLERATTRRRELERAVALRVLLVSGERLRTDHAHLQQRLRETREQLAPIVVYALQKGLAAPVPDQPPTQVDLEHLWRALLDDPESQAAARHLAMSVATHDLLLLMADLLESSR